jgi:hypothetical protein
MVYDVSSDVKLERADPSSMPRGEKPDRNGELLPRSSLLSTFSMYTPLSPEAIAQTLGLPSAPSSPGPVHERIDKVNASPLTLLALADTVCLR